MPFATKQDIRIERDWAVDVARNAANCLGNLYNLLASIDEEETVADAMKRRDNTVRVLETEMSHMDTYKLEVLAEIERRLEDRRVAALLQMAATVPHNSGLSD